MAEPKIHLSERAAGRVRKLISEGKLPATGGLRLAVQGGGCSGLTYAVRFDKQPTPRDQVFEFEGARVFVDPKSLIYLAGMVVDYESNLMQQRFVFQNPNATKGCSCGESFSP